MILLTGEALDLSSQPLNIWTLDAFCQDASEDDWRSSLPMAIMRAGRVMI